METVKIKNLLMKKKLTIVVNDLRYFFSHRLPIALEAEKIGYSISVIYGSNKDEKLLKHKKTNFDYYFVPIERGSLNPFKEIKSIYLLFKYFKKNKSDLIHLVTLKPCLYVGLVARILKFKNILFAFPGLGIIFKSNKFKLRLIKFLLLPVFKYIFQNKNYLALFQNDDDQKVFINLNLTSKDKTRLTKGSGVDISKFKKTVEPPEPIVVTFASRLIYDKGITFFISAAKELIQKKTNIKFLVAGSTDEGNPNSIRKETIEQWKKIKEITFLGDVPNMFEVYEKSHIICLPSFYGEGLPKVLIEAASCGKAIITTDHPGCRDAVINKKTGLLIPIKDSEKLSDQIEYLALNHKLRKSMGTEGRKLAESQFSINLVVEQHMKIYDDILNKL